MVTMQVSSSQPNRRRVWAITVAAVVVALVVGTVGGYLLFQAHPNALTKILRNPGTAFTLPGQVAPITKKAKDTGSLDPNKTLQLSIALPLRNQAKLNLLLQNQRDPNSPFYQDFLTPQEFQTDYAPLPATVTEVSSFLKASGLNVTGVSGSNQFIKVSDTVANIQSAFHVQLRNYSIGGKTYYGPAAGPQVPYGLRNVIQNVSGLDNFSLYHTASRLQPRAGGNGYTPAQLQKAYNASGLLSQGIDGSGQNIAFLELDGYSSQDVQSYQQQYNLSGGTFETVSVGGASYDANPGQGAIEVELDMEVAFAMAPKVHEFVYEGQNSGQGINDVYSQIVNDKKAKIVSISWGLCEQQSGSAELQTLDQIFQQGAAEGMSFFAAAGDSGAYDCGDNTVNVDSPADDPYVTGVGGTHLTTASDGTYTSETAWSCTDANCTSKAPNGSGGGGGISQQFQAPSFQSGLNPSGANGQTGRFVPDVSANADPQTGYAIVCTVSTAGCTGSGIVVGGTSAAAPLWAGGAALMNQSLAKSNKQLGNVNAALYAASSAQNSGFHDVTSGTNLLYNAGPGYDLATGLGSPDFTALAASLASGKTGTGGGTPTPTPTPGGGNTPTPNPTSGTGGNPTPTPVPTTGTGGNPTGGQELLSNNGFENGTSPWSESSAGQYELIVDSSTGKPHAGNYDALLCGYANCQDSILQGFQLPQSASHVILSYWWNMATQKSGACTDVFQVQIYSTTDNGDGTYSLGSPLGQPAQSTCDKNSNNQYQQKTVDVTSQLQGQSSSQVFAVVFSMTTDGQSNTSQVNLDDVSLQAG